MTRFPATSQLESTGAARSTTIRATGDGVVRYWLTRTPLTCLLWKSIRGRLPDSTALGRSMTRRDGFSNLLIVGAIGRLARISIAGPSHAEIIRTDCTEATSVLASNCGWDCAAARGRTSHSSASAAACARMGKADILPEGFPTRTISSAGVAEKYWLGREGGKNYWASGSDRNSYSSMTAATATFPTEGP